MTEQISFSRNKFRRFKKAYCKAVDNKQTEFTFDGHLFYTEYAKYMIEYISPYFKHTKEVHK